MRIDRLLEIVILLLNNTSVTGKQLSEKLEVSIRTIQRDITALSMAGVPIVSNAGSTGGYSILDGYKLKNDFVKEDDFSLIIMALKSLGTSYESKRLNAILEKYVSVSDGRQPCVSLDYGVTREGTKIQESNRVLESCIEQKKQVSFHYKNADGKASKRRVNPLALHFKWYAWYLFAFDADKKDYRTFKVVRMTDLAVTSLTFNPPENVPSLLEEQERAYDQNCEHILVWCPNENISMLEEHFPDAAFVQQKDGSWMMDLFVPLSEKLWQSFLIGLGNHIKIISPLAYRDLLISTAKNFIENYDI